MPTLSSSRLRLAPSLTIEQEDAQGVVIANIQTGSRVRISRSIHEIMHRFRAPALVADVLSDRESALVEAIMKTLIEKGFLHNLDESPRVLTKISSNLMRVSPTLFRTPDLGSTEAPTDIAILGIPYDGGNVVGAGARGGPQAIRTFSCEQEYRVDFLTGAPIGWLDVDTMERVLCGVTMCDWGDVRFTYGQSPQTLFDAIESIIFNMIKRKSMPVCLGGDHSISYPLVKALQSFRPINVVWFDGHTDCARLSGSECHHHGNVVTRIVELPNVRHVLNIGFRNFAVGTLETIKKRNVSIVSPAILRAKGPESVVDMLSQDPCYVSLDVDALDAAFAPATSTPVPDGLAPEDIKSMLRALGARRELVGMDVVELNPLRDLSGITAMRMCQMITVFLNAAFRNRTRCDDRSAERRRLANGNS